MKYLIIALVMFFGIFLSLPSSAVPQVRCSAPDNAYPGDFWAKFPDLWANCDDGEKPNGGGSRWVFECDKRKNTCSVTLTFILKKSIFSFAQTKGEIDVSLDLKTAPTDGSRSRQLHSVTSKAFIDTIVAPLKNKMQRRYVTFNFPYAPLHAHLEGKPFTTEIKAVMEIDPPTGKKTKWDGTWYEKFLVGQALEGNESNNTMSLVTVKLNAEVQ